MPTTQTQLFPPPSRAAAVDAKGFIAISFRQWLFTLQYLLPLRLADTSGGPYSEALPPAGLNSTTGQSNQNAEIVYIKSSADGNTFTLTGAIDGPHTLTTQYQALRFKSDGTNWWPSQAASGGGGGGSVLPGTNVIPLPPPPASIFPGTSETSPATTAANSIVQYIPGNSLLCQPTNWQITVKVAISTTFNFTLVKCTQYTGAVLATMPITFGGVTNPTLGVGLNTSDSMSFALTSGFDYFLIAHSTGSGTNLWLVNNGTTFGGSYVETSDFTSTNPITFIGGAANYGFFITNGFESA